MINIISEDARLNPELSSFPSAEANIAIFGTQSSGKSTLCNEAFGTSFPVLNTQITRERCTKGVWFQSTAKFNIIDTEGFDSNQRPHDQKILEKQIALFCLALSDVLIINMWMNQVGRYEGSHSHILKAIVKTSERIISSQTKRIVVMVRDCTQDADRGILRQELSQHVNGLIKSETKKPTVKFTVQYFFISHYEEERDKFKKQAKQFVRVIGQTKKSTISNYNPQDRIVYIRNLWSQVTSAESEIDLRAVEDALKNYTLDRIKKQTLDYIEGWLEKWTTLQKFTTYERYVQGIRKEAQSYFLNQKPKHLQEKDINETIQSVYALLENRYNKHFMTVLLPNQEDQLIGDEYEQKLDEESQKKVGIITFQRLIQKKRKDLIQIHKKNIKGLKEYAKLTRRFTDKLQNKTLKYQQYIQHLQNLFQIDLEKQLNEEIDRQTAVLVFNPQKIDQTIKIVEEKHKWQISKKDQGDIWNKVVQRTLTNSLLEKLKQEGEKCTVEASVFGNQTSSIINYFRQLEKKTKNYIEGLTNYLNSEQSVMNLEYMERVKEVTSEILERKLIEQRSKFKITLALVAILMFFFFSEFSWLLKFMGVRKKRIRRWLWLYAITMVTSFGVLAYRNREYFKKFITQNQ